MKEIWELPIPSTSLLNGVKFSKLLGRECSLKGEYEDDDGTTGEFCLEFNGVEAYKCTYMTSCSLVMHEAYGKLVDCGDSNWLYEIREAFDCDNNDCEELKHYMFYPDDGPCYEVICSRVDVL